MSTPTFDPDALAQEYQALSEAPPVPEAEASPEGNHPEGTTEENHSTADAPTDPAEPAPASSPEGLKPSGQDPEAVAEDPDFKHALEIAGIKDPAQAEKVLAKKLVEFNKRLAEQAKELKTFREQKAPETPQPAAQPVPAPAVPAPAAAAPVVVPAQPAGDADLETTVTEAVSQDQSYRAFLTELESYQAQESALVSRDERGAFVGELPEIDSEIAAIKNLLGPFEALKRSGLPVPEIDEYTKERYENRLAKLEIDRAVRVSRLQDLQFRQERVQQRMEGRKDQVRQHFRTQLDQKRHDEEREKGIEDKAATYLQTWNSTFEAVATALGVEEDDRSELYDLLTAKAALDRSVIDRPKEFMERAIKAEQERLEKAYRARQAKNATLKRNDSIQPAPKGTAAVAPPSPTASQDWEERLLASAAAEMRSATR